MIPKIIHYCWFGKNELPKEVLAYIESWKKYFPDFEIKQWDETNFDVNKRKYTEQAFYAKKYAFVSDVARLEALVKEGGLYFDTDILVKKAFPTEWFELSGFAGFEHEEYVGTGIIAAEKNHPYYKEFLSQYDTKHFFRGIEFDVSPNVPKHTELLKAKGYIMNNQEQSINNFTLFPQIMLCGKDWQKGRYDTDETYAVHDYKGSWNNNTPRSIIGSKLYMLKTIGGYYLNNGRKD